jgi:hypothetical protein
LSWATDLAGPPPQREVALAPTQDSLSALGTLVALVGLLIAEVASQRTEFGTLVALVRLLLALVRLLLALVGAPVTLVGLPVALVCAPVTLVGLPVALVGAPVTLVGLASAGHGYKDARGSGSTTDTFDARPRLVAAEFRIHPNPPQTARSRTISAGSICSRLLYTLRAAERFDLDALDDDPFEVDAQAATCSNTPTSDCKTSTTCGSTTRSSTQPNHRRTG